MTTKPGPTWSTNTLAIGVASAALAALVGFAGCDPDDSESAAAPPVAAPTTAASITSASSAPPAQRDPSAIRFDPALRPRPNRARGEEALSLNQTCVDCHREEARAWAGSHHQRAYDNPAFQAALAIEPLPFCRGCHAAEADPKAVPSAALGSLGVGCVTCHVVEADAVLAAGAEDAVTPATATMPHAVRRSMDFAKTGGCASCHEFTFPGAPPTEDGHFMQTTVREHDRSPKAERACASCHMPQEGAGRSHAFTSVRDAEWLRSALAVKAESGALRMTTITLQQTRAGHAFPTGDLFRRLEVGAEVVDAKGKVLARDARYLRRHLDAVPGKRGRTLVKDDRVMFEPLEVDLDVSCDAAPKGATLRWWVTYQRVAQTGDGKDPERAEVESEVPLYAGTLCGGAIQ
ncbi:MAG: hypothetical protein HOW73_48450 [Polyangiaceae bacterium]|nr:hypothetical protein [Polyangiaceae bacterium]